ncbi:hypothetical protein [Paraglaciecola sp.]|uniref:hypothetical protein n=1 Tax=Paraglaciecola sp. TaxID=1920173 RepID=UPI0032632C76
MLKANHKYVVFNSVSVANVIIQSKKLGKRPRIILEYKSNDPTTRICNFNRITIKIDDSKEVPIFVKEQAMPLEKSKKWRHGAIFCCPHCGYESDMTGKQ